MHDLTKLLKTPTALGVLLGSVLVGAPGLTEAVSAQATNPCPGVYYEEPFASRIPAPQGCPPNAANAATGQGGAIPTPRPDVSQCPPNAATGQGGETSRFEPVTPGEVTTPRTPGNLPRVIPPPEVRSEPIAMVSPTDGMVSVTLINNTNAPITYEAIGHTERRTLSGSEEATLTELPTPVTLTMVRQDYGFLTVEAVESDSGMLVLSLDEESSFIDANQGVIEIQENGQVFLN